MQSRIYKILLLPPCSCTSRQQVRMTEEIKEINGIVKFVSTAGDVKPSEKYVKEEQKQKWFLAPTVVYTQRYIGPKAVRVPPGDCWAPSFQLQSRVVLKHSSTCRKLSQHITESHILICPLHCRNPTMTGFTFLWHGWEQRLLSRIQLGYTLTEHKEQ